MVTLSVVLPAFNEERGIAASITRLAGFLGAQPGAATSWASWEILVVDDGSGDRTAQAAQGALPDDARLRVVRLPTHAGKGAAVKAGCAAASGDAIVVTDVDLSYALESVSDAVAALASGAQMVTGDRRHPESRIDRTLAARAHASRRERISLVFNLAVRLFYGLPWKDTQCGLKAFTRESASIIMPRLRTAGFLADIEMFLIAAGHGMKVATIPVRLTWLSSDSTVHVVNQTPEVILDALRIKWAQILRRYDRGSVP